MDMTRVYFSRPTYVFLIVIVVFYLVTGISTTDHDGFTVWDLKSSNPEVISLKEANRHLPTQCRTDICLPTNTTDEYKGDISWPEAYLDTVVRIKCPYSMSGNQYATRKCVKKNNENINNYYDADVQDDSYAFFYGMNDYNVVTDKEIRNASDVSEDKKKEFVVWLDPQITNCPDPPFTEWMKRLHRNLTTATLVTSQWFKKNLRISQKIVEGNPNNPVFVEDGSTWVSFLSSMVSYFRDNVNDYQITLSMENVQEILDVSSYIIGGKKVISYITQEERERFLTSLSLLGAIMHEDELHRWPNTLHSDNIVAQLDHVYVTNSNNAGARLSGVLNETEEFSTPTVIISAKVKSDQDPYFGRSLILYTMTLKSADAFVSSAKLMIDRPSWMHVPSHLDESTPPRPTIPMQTLPFDPPPTMPVPSSLSKRGRRDTSYNNVPWSATLREPLGTSPPPYQEEATDKVIKHGDTLKGSMIYVGLVNTRTRTMLDYNTYMQLNVDILFHNKREGVCSRAASIPLDNSSPDVFTEWTDDVCETFTLRGAMIYCRCNGLGYFGLFSATDRGAGGGLFPPKPTDEENDPLSQFVGFPHQWELYIVGHILRVFSMIGLILTIVSYVLIRNNRRGSTPLILGNLCVSLLGLLLALYVAERLAHTYNGCRVANLLRYYFVMVSLFWNGVEAVNMYMKLVKVFNSHVSHLVLKAAIVAWGVPLVMIAVALIVNIEMFDGYYIECDFRCGMKTPLLYYGYLLPMGLIIVYNLTVFVMVLRIIISGRHSKKPGREKQSKREHLMRLAGAVTVLVLLGIPWIFSAFGVIESERGSLRILEGVFQVIFVVFVNMQGVFIFIFHCARNKEVRQEWSRLATSGLSSTSTARSSIELPASNSKTRKPIEDIS